MLEQENNGAVTAAVSELLLVHGVPADRIYINFFDVPRENVCRKVKPPPNRERTCPWEKLL